ncbi:MAG: hypothetical protein QOJ50_3600, partial [Cryptosporangiaceae bacterium]|nr:hypothetical protein [Cryptosporangiaceae bacterium]
MHKYALRVAVASGLVLTVAVVAVGARTAFTRDTEAGESNRAERALDADAPSGEEAEGEGAEGPAGADDWFALQRTYPAQAVDIGQKLSAARGQAATLARASGRLAPAATWQPLGPANVGGRVTDLVADPAHSGTVYAAAATGGVWKSTDAGATFSRAWSAADPASVGALAMTPSGVLYAGTGEGNPGGG